MGIIINNVSYIYGEGTSFASKALENINLEINDGDFVAIIGRTGSGKSTLIQLMNGLIKPTSGEVYYNGADIWDEDYDRVALRGQVGMVFQYPENQLFETTVIKDVCFGPANIGMSKLDIELNSYNALKMVGISDDYIDDSPLDLSGGMKRRVALAGVLAMKPKVLILDEPTAGLDPAGRTQILELIKRLNEEEKITIILVSHSMEDVAKYAKKVSVMCDSHLIAYGDTPYVFGAKDVIEKAGLKLPAMVQLYYKLQEKGFLLRKIPMDENEAFELIKEGKL